jgi:hypothetical protein
MALRPNIDVLLKQNLNFYKEDNMLAIHNKPRAFAASSDSAFYDPAALMGKGLPGMTKAKLALLPIILLGFSAAQVQATEGGGSTYSGGVENFLVGATPPPGFYWLSYGQIYRANKLKDNDGNSIPVPGFKVSANALVLRPVWSTNTQLLGGNLIFHAVIPLVDLKVAAAGASQHKTAIGDVTLGVFGIGTHYSPQLHTALALDIVVPTGQYNKNNLANIGRNYTSFQPLYALSYIDPKGFNGDFKLTFNINTKNRDTDYKSGNELFLDYSLGWGLGNSWTVGVGGYLRNQLSDDTQNGVKVPNNRAKNFAIGPSIKYQPSQGWFITAKYQKETSTRNTTQGNAFWVKAVLPF